MTVIAIEKGAFKTICQEFSFNDLVGQLKTLFRITDAEKILEYRDLMPWTRGGAETYISSGIISLENRSVKFICKAIVSGMNAAVSTSSWLQKRALLETVDVPTPTLFFGGNGLIIEQFIDKSFCLQMVSHDNVLKQVGFIARRLDDLGFQPLNFQYDLRWEGDSVYYVDFGFDLGNSSRKKTFSALRQLTSGLPSSQRLKAAQCYFSV